MHRASRLALAVLIALVAVVFSSTIVDADLENQQRGEGGVFVSKTDQLRMVVPRGWHATEQLGYPGFALWMSRAAPPDASMVLTAEPFTRRVYCSWPVKCRTSHDTLQVKLACALRDRLAAQHLRVGPVQAGPKDNEANGMPSVWFEYDDGKKFLRQAVALTEDHVVSLLLSTGSFEARAGYVRAFEQTLRTLRPLTADELGSASAPTETTQAAPPPPVVAPVAPSDAGVDATLLVDAAVAAPTVAAPSLPSAPAAKVNPVGSCTQ